MRLEPQLDASWHDVGDRRTIYWLGQAGFWINSGAHRLLIDPYLSDSLAQKYAGKLFDHRRMIPPPMPPDALPRPDIVLITHAHTDHMDGETLRPLYHRFPDVPFVVPAARLDVARVRIGENARLIGVDADKIYEPLSGLQLTTFPAAHETFEQDEQGRHLFLGFGVASGGMRLVHSGDTIPYEGLAQRWRAFGADVLLLPVNGRDDVRKEAGIPGNLTLDEAITLTREAGATYLIAHHFGMFAFNTIDPALIDAAAKQNSSPIILRPEIGVALTWQEV